MTIESIKKKILENKFRLSQHAENEKQYDKILYYEIDEAFENIELIEDYPDDPRGCNCLLLGFASAGKPLHFVCGELDEERMLFVTMHRPQPGEWIDFRIRRK